MVVDTVEPTLSRVSSVFECDICPNRCRLSAGDVGKCLVRKADGTGIYLSEYGKLTNICVEPVEKKPLYHYKPGLKTLSVGGYGCVYSCGYCANFTVSQRDRSQDAKLVSPSELVSLAKSKGCGAICFTYNEPIIYIEYVNDVYKEADNSIDIILKTCAYAEPRSWEIACNVSDSMNIDWKGPEDRYLSVALHPRGPVMKNIREAYDRGIHIEISIPIYHDSKIEEYEEIRDFLASINPFIPCHLLKIFPANRDNLVPVTSSKLLLNIHKLMREKLYFCYIANEFSSDYAEYRNTICPSCMNVIVERTSLKSEVFSHKISCPMERNVIIS